ncbi:MAG: hypothetical protein AAGC76_09675 [Luteibacter sp.]|uniref:hypothetical protein n=1 Tax=Luteibacter sp. TaxID=1886636 RepID=UPI002809B790|nr:hypothetical protein [Luteibacter sp.]MDQ7996110.1 hypothetical protein [Luteibacter sp.]
MTTKDGGRAFPVLDADTTGLHCREGGMSLRDYFAAKALSSMQLNSDFRYSDVDRQRGFPEREAEWAATAAYRYADAMVAARESK